MRKRRKVTFADSFAREVHCNEDMPSPTAQRDLPLIDKSAKTSEFKYFRKLQEEASNIHKTSTVPLHDNCTNRSKAKNKSEETYAMFTSKLQNSSCLTHEKPITVAERLTSPAKTPENKEIKYRVEFKDDARRSLAQNCEVTPLGQSLLPPKHYKEWNSDVKFQCEESFSGKRRKLLQLVAGSLPSEIYKHMSCRSDLIPFLLQRLGIRRMINSHKELLTSGEVFPERSTHNSFKSGTIHQPDDVKYMAHSAVAAIVHLPMNFQSPSWNVVDELKTPTLDLAANPYFSHFEDELLRIKHSNWNFDEQEASKFCLEWSNYEGSKNQCCDIDSTTSKVECSIPSSLFACNGTKQSVIPCAKSKFSELTDLPNSLFPCNVTEQSLMPYAKSKFSDITDLPNSLLPCDVTEQSLMPYEKSKFSELTDLHNSLFACDVTEQSLMPCAKSKFSELTDLPNSLFACDVTEQSLMPYVKSKFSELTELPSGLFTCNVTEQSLVPYNKSKSSELMDLNQVEESVIPLTYSEMTEVEPEFPFASRNLVHRETDDWPLSYFAFSSFMKVRDGLEECDAFYSPLRNKHSMLFQDSTFRRLCPTPRHVLELEWKSMPAASTHKCMFFSNKITDQQLYQDMIQDGHRLMDSH